MNLKAIRFFSICVFIVFALALCFFGVSVYKNISLGKTQINDILNSIINDTTAFINYYGITENFTTQYTEYVQKNKDIAGLIILQDTSSCFAYPMSSSLIKIDNFGEPVINGNSPILTIFSSSLPVENYVDINITVAVYLIQPSKIFQLAKISFLIILFATAVVFVVLMFQYKTLKSSENNSSNLFDISFEKKEKNDDVNIESENNANDYVPQNEEQPENDIMLEEENQIDLDLELEAEEKAQETSQFNPFASNISDPQGLFSKFTGLGWESYLETRLDSELGRAASAEQDLAFFLIAIENFNFQNQIIPHLTSILLEKFKFRDLVFEYGTNGFAAIVQGMNLDRAMALTQELYTDISGLLVNYQMNNKFGIGITTRSLRLITGNRLIDEAQQALNKAFDEEGLPIVAFRVNPEKYRQCLADNE